MKINTDVFPLKQLKTENNSTKKHTKLEKNKLKSDSIELSDNEFLKVSEENRSASGTELVDFRNAEEEISNLAGKLDDDVYTASEIHQLDDQRVLYLSLD